MLRIKKTNKLKIHAFMYLIYYTGLTCSSVGHQWTSQHPYVASSHLGFFGCFPVDQELSGQLINFPPIQNLCRNSIRLLIYQK